MFWQQWVLLGWLLVTITGYVAKTGQPRETYRGLAGCLFRRRGGFGRLGSPNHLKE